MKLGLILTIILAFASGSFAQSGRIQPAETPTPKPAVPRPNIIYIPTQEHTFPTFPPKASPTPKKPDATDEVITVDSTLVPIPVSVLDGSGRTISTLSLSDFELQVDGKKAEISDI